MDFSVQRGATMDNNLLSKFTTYYGEILPASDRGFEESYLDNLDKIHWEISAGEDNSDATDGAKKSVGLALAWFSKRANRPSSIKFFILFITLFTP